MKTKIVGIFVCMLLTATALPVVGMNDTDIQLPDVSQTMQGVLDQYQDTNEECIWFSDDTKSLISMEEVITSEDEDSDGLFGWVFLRGWIFNPREDGSKITARAINLQYTEINFQGINKGVARLKKVSFRNGFFIKLAERGVLGYIVHVSGFCHGGLEIL